MPCYLVSKILKLRQKEPLVITSRKLSPKNISRIKTNINNANLESLAKKHISAEQALDAVHAKIVEEIDKIAPYESYTPSKKWQRNCEWLPNSLLRSIAKQKKLYKKVYQNLQLNQI